MTTMTRETSIRCGNCGGRHGSAADVRNCYHTTMRPGRRSGEWAGRPAIKVYDNTTPASGIPDVPAGHYAVPSLTGNNDLDFFRVDRPTEGRWAGRTFVKRVIGGRPSVAVRGATARQALEAIAKAGPEEAMKKYGQEIGQCGKCNRHLTDELSRSLGIGPVCRG